ncbi:MAG: phosphoesterase [Candidatus Poribacteria bacterium]|nr:MAG: phosphoesterase [Candidatus Poribacteria bacterium]
MKIGVISDTHDNLAAIEAAARRFVQEGVQYVVHAGDYIFPATARAFAPIQEAGVPFLGIFGNNDGERFGLRKMYEPIGPIHEDPHRFELGGRRILVTHREVLVDALAKSGDFDVVIYGHTHQVDLRTEPCLILNPGEACGWLSGRRTVALLDLETLKAEIVELA